MPVLEEVMSPPVLLLALMAMLLLASRGDYVQELLDDKALTPVERGIDNIPGKAAERVKHAAKLYRLSGREEEVLELLASGHNIAAMSKRLGVSENTTKTHMRRLFAKMAVHSRQEVVDLLEELGPRS